MTIVNSLSFEKKEAPKSTLNDSKIDPNNYWVFGYGSLIYKPPPHTEVRVPGYITGYVRRFWQSSNDHRGTPEAPGRVVTLIEYEFWKLLTKNQKTSLDNSRQNSQLNTCLSNSSDPHGAPEDGKTWGVAYKIIPKYASMVKEYLDYREKNGYTEHQIPFTIDPTFLDNFNKANLKWKFSNEEKDIVFEKNLPTVIVCHAYIGTPENEAFIGPQEPENLAHHIVLSKGPSGENREYLYKLHSSLQNLAYLSNSDDEERVKYEFPEDEHISDLVRRARNIEKKLNLKRLS